MCFFQKSNTPAKPLAICSHHGATTAAAGSHVRLVHYAQADEFVARSPFGNLAANHGPFVIVHSRTPRKPPVPHPCVAHVLKPRLKPHRPRLKCTIPHTFAVPNHPAMTNRQCVCTAANAGEPTFEVVDSPIPTPGAEDVLIKVLVRRCSVLFGYDLFLPWPIPAVR